MAKPGLRDARGVARPHVAASARSRATDGKVTALDIQWELYDRAKKYEPSTDSASVGEAVGADLHARGGSAVLAALESDVMSLADQLDWVAKYRLFDAYRERNGLAWNDARLRAMDLQYHDLRPEKSLFARVGMQRLVDDAEVEEATTEPPAHHEGIFPGKVPAEVGRRHRGRELGFTGVRRGV